MRKLKFYLLGFTPGLLLVLFFLNRKGASCSYFPNDRVIAETLSKKFIYSDNFKTEMEILKINEKFLKDSIITKGKIDFDKSQAQATPCPKYLLQYPAKHPRYEVDYNKCKEEATFINIKKIR